MAEGFLEKAGTFAQDAAVDTVADGFINKAIDGVTEHLPGGGAIDAMAKTGIDLAANNAINAELGNIEGGFGHHDAAPTAAATADAPVDAAGDDSQT